LRERRRGMPRSLADVGHPPADYPPAGNPMQIV